MSNTQGTLNEYVEVELSIDLTYYRPTTNENGELTFTEFCPDEAWSCFKCKVPKEVVGNKTTLTKYVREVMCDYDVIDLNTVNIWDADKEVFRFAH